MSNIKAATKFVPVAKVSDLKPGTMKSFVVENRHILLAMVADKYYAADNKCPHMGADLSLGRLEGSVLTCPRHGSQFDLTDGKVLRWTSWTGFVARASQLLRSPRPLAVYPVKVEGDNILVGIP